MNLRQAASGMPCMIRAPGICNRDTATTVLCHVRLAGVSGLGHKAPDLLGAWGCYACHEYCDSNKEGGRLMLLEGMLRTQAKLIEMEAVKW